MKAAKTPWHKEEQPDGRFALFGADGVLVAIDLTRENALLIEEAISAYADAASEAYKPRAAHENARSDVLDLL